ncbi:MAG: N-6 DNA methylase [Spirochaetes bacterium]|nr:N-6 DNA methylase [Spirochaetota bacterium]
MELFHRSVSALDLSKLYQRAHDYMRNIDGLLPQDAFHELIKILFVFVRAPRLKGNKIQSTKEVWNSALRRELSKTKINGKEAFIKEGFSLSEKALIAVVNLFSEIDFRDLDIDVKSAAISAFVKPETRRGLGLFLTPDQVADYVVRACIDYFISLNNHTPNIVLDAASGTGTFLQKARLHLKSLGVQLFGSEINTRLCLLAEINLSRAGQIFALENEDFLLPQTLKTIRGTVELLITNPPFGVQLNPANYEGSGLLSFDQAKGNRVPSEIAFLEKCLQMLKPNGVLGIILPRSVITNDQFLQIRRFLGTQARLLCVANLPPETFQITGTQTTTTILFAVKEHVTAKTEVEIEIRDITNVGFDATGRLREGSQISVGALLPELQMRALKVDADNTFNVFSASMTRPSGVKSKTHDYLGDLADITIGKTPPRSEYTDSGAFIAKVGNLTGMGIDWEPRDRNFVSEREIAKRFNTGRALLQINDIILTSSAHAQRYIAQKIDIVSYIPEAFRSRLTFVGEVMRIRLLEESKIDPYMLLAFLHQSTTKDTIRRMVRGQTAHLNPTDMRELAVPKNILTEKNILNLARLYRDMNDAFNQAIARKMEIVSKRVA